MPDYRYVRCCVIVGLHHVSRSFTTTPALTPLDRGYRRVTPLPPPLTTAYHTPDTTFHRPLRYLSPHFVIRLRYAFYAPFGLDSPPFACYHVLRLPRFRLRLTLRSAEHRCRLPHDRCRSRFRLLYPTLRALRLICALPGSCRFVAFAPGYLRLTYTPYHVTFATGLHTSVTAYPVTFVIRSFAFRCLHSLTVGHCRCVWLAAFYVIYGCYCLHSTTRTRSTFGSFISDAFLTLTTRLPFTARAICPSLPVPIPAQLRLLPLFYLR